MANRPQIDPNRKETASVQYMVRLTPQQAAKVRRLAQRRGVTVAQVMREAVLKVSR